ncbi:hypothetical protein ACFWWC_46575 [Streptomyces sp. NPDC058642]|uniref:hypothetical protein n=1 Tax=Streptomyces sp. NPDC058642 TaxID=3346572 RepID=UPI003669827F
MVSFPEALQARETVVQVLAELSAAEEAPNVEARDTSEPQEAPTPHGIGVMAVPPWREGLATTAKIEGMRGKLKPLVERGWLHGDTSGRSLNQVRPSDNDDDVAMIALRTPLPPDPPDPGVRANRAGACLWPGNHGPEGNPSSP